MRILLLNYEFPPAGGGAGFATMNIGRELVRLGFEVDVLTAVINGESDGDIVDGMRVFRVPSWRKGLHDCGFIGAYSYTAFAALKRRKLHKATQYDLEHYFFSLPTGAMTLTPFAGEMPPYIVSLRGSDVPGYDPFNASVERLHKILRPITVRIWRKAAAVVALSNALRDTALITAPDVDIRVISNGMDVSKFSAKEIETERNTDRPLRLVSVARLLERKGIQHLLEAIASPVPLNVSLSIIGTGPYEDSLKTLTAELGLEDRVSFAGFIDSDSLPEHYRDADLFVLPSQTESFGLVFAEAMASGLPIIATRVGGIPELIRSGTEGILVNPASAGEIREALEYFTDNPEALDEMGLAGRRRIEDKYTWSTIASAYARIYEEVC